MSLCLYGKFEVVFTSVIAFVVESDMGDECHLFDFLIGPKRAMELDLSC